MENPNTQEDKTTSTIVLKKHLKHHIYELVKRGINSSRKIRKVILAEDIKVNAPTIFKALSELTGLTFRNNEQVLRQAQPNQPPETSKGRPSKAFECNPRVACAIGIEVSPDNVVRLAALDVSGNALFSQESQIRGSSEQNQDKERQERFTQEEVLATVQSLLKRMDSQLVQTLGRMPTPFVVLTLPAQYDPNTNAYVRCVKFPFLRDEEKSKEFIKRFSKALSFELGIYNDIEELCHFDNDANSSVYALWRFVEIERRAGWLGPYDFAKFKKPEGLVKRRERQEDPFSSPWVCILTNTQGLGVGIMINHEVLWGKNGRAGELMGLSRRGDRKEYKSGSGMDDPIRNYLLNPEDKGSQEWVKEDLSLIIRVTSSILGASVIFCYVSEGLKDVAGFSDIFISGIEKAIEELPKDRQIWTNVCSHEGQSKTETIGLQNLITSQTGNPDAVWINRLKPYPDKEEKNDFDLSLPLWGAVLQSYDRMMQAIHHKIEYPESS